MYNFLTRIFNVPTFFALLGAELILFLILSRLLGESRKTPAEYKNERIQSAIDEERLIPKYAHLSLHFAEKRRTQRYQDLPYFVVNDETKQAYYAQNYILELADTDIIEAHPYPEQKALYAFFKTADIELNLRFPRPEELGVSEHD